MGRVAGLAEGRCAHIELIHCSSDPESLDGVILHDIKAAIADGTAPHAIEPKYPGAFEQTIDLSSCWDEHRLFEARREIMTLAAKIDRCREHCCRFLGAAASLLADTCRIAREATDEAKAVKAAGRIARAEFKSGPARPGRESVRFLSCVTDRGPLLFGETASALCDRVYLIEDVHGASSRLLLNALRAEALAAGFDVISCYCPLAPFEKLEHLFVPALSLGFLTANEFHQPQVEPFKIVRARRFTDADRLRGSRGRLTFNRKAAAQMVDSAARLCADQKALHDRLEAVYADATDYRKVEEACGRTLTRFERLLAEAGL